MKNNYSYFQKRLLSAFPKHLSKDVEKVWEFLERHNSLQNIHSVENNISYKGEVLSIPYRMYFDQNIDLLAGSLTEVQKSILNCIGLMHFEGRVREGYLKKIMVYSEGFEIPFVFQLIGDYVVGIIEITDLFIRENLNYFLDFIVENPEYFGKIEDRMRSYWHCYYRWEYPDVTKYVGFKIIATLKKKIKDKNTSTEKK